MVNDSFQSYSRITEIEFPPNVVVVCNVPIRTVNQVLLVKYWTSTTSIRVAVNNSLADHSRIVEVEALGIPSSQSLTPPKSNVALASRGATASASSTYSGSASFPSGAIIDGDRRGSGWGSGGGWNDDTSGIYPDWVEVNFSGSKTISEIDIFTLQDDYGNPVEPTETSAFSQYGITEFDVQYWDGATWQTVPDGTVTGNDKVWRRLVFPEVTTNKIRILINNSLAGYSRVTEVEAWGYPEGAPPP